VDVSKHHKTTACHGLIALLNPRLVSSVGKDVSREGCMSVPDWTANVARPASVAVAGFSADGEPLLIDTEGFEARALMHELDHLNGALILDRVASLATDVFRRKTYR
jgi:peptide deformylase